MAFAGERYRIGIATRGFRGGAGGGNFYINETVTLEDLSTTTDIEISTASIDIDIPSVNVNIFSDSFDVTVSSTPEIAITTEIETIEVTVEDC